MKIKGAEEGEWTLFSSMKGRTEAVFMGLDSGLWMEEGTGTAEPRGRRDPPMAPLGSSESRQMRALLKNHCPVARSLWSP